MKSVTQTVEETGSGVVIWLKLPRGDTRNGLYRRHGPAGTLRGGTAAVEPLLSVLNEKVRRGIVFRASYWWCRRLPVEERRSSDILTTAVVGKGLRTVNHRGMLPVGVRTAPVAVIDLYKQRICVPGVGIPAD